MRNEGYATAELRVQKARKIISNWMKGGRVLVLNVPLDPALWSTSDEYSGHKRRYTRESLTDILVSSGLKVVGMYCYSFPLLRIYWNIRKMLKIDSKIDSKTIKDNKFDSFIIRVVRWLPKIMPRIILLTDTKFLSTNKGVGLLAIARKGD